MPNRARRARGLSACPLGAICTPVGPIVTVNNWPSSSTSLLIGSLKRGGMSVSSCDWKQWELYAGVGFIAEDVTPAMLHGFRRALEGRLYAVNMIRGIVSVCKLVCNWAEREELIGRNRWRLYQLKIAKDAQPESPAEYRHEDLDCLLRQFDPRKASQWRPWVALTLLGAQGVRQVAALQLRWSDLDLRHRVIVSPKATDKRGRDSPQALARVAVRALRVAREMARRQGVHSAFVLYGTRGAPCYTIQRLWKALRHAEEKAGIPHRPSGPDTGSDAWSSGIWRRRRATSCSRSGPWVTRMRGWRSIISRIGTTRCGGRFECGTGRP